MLRRVAAFCRPLRPVLLLVSCPRSRSPVVGVPGLCWMWRDVPFARQRRPIIPPPPPPTVVSPSNTSLVYTIHPPPIGGSSRCRHPASGGGGVPKKTKLRGTNGGACGGWDPHLEMPGYCGMPPKPPPKAPKSSAAGARGRATRDQAARPKRIRYRVRNTGGAFGTAFDGNTRGVFAVWRPTPLCHDTILRGRGGRSTGWLWVPGGGGLMLVDVDGDRLVLEGMGGGVRFRFVVAVCYWRSCWPPHTLPVESGRPPPPRTVQTRLTRGGCDRWWVGAAGHVLGVRGERGRGLRSKGSCTKNGPKIFSLYRM